MRPATMLPLSLLAVLAWLASPIAASLLAIDYGAEWTKASLIKPGVPFDVLLDRDSKRKMMSAVGWKRDERLFGGEAANAATRFPATYYPYVKGLVGGTEVPANLSSIWPVQPQVSEGGMSLQFAHVDAPPAARPASSSSTSTSWTSEELLAQQFAYVKHLAASAASEPVRDLFLTVPPYFSQSQRRALKDAAEIAGLNLVGMMGEGTAVGINYAMTRSFPQAEYHVVFDSGAMKTTATVLKMETLEVPVPLPLSTKKSPSTKVQTVNTTFITVLSTASERWLGGLNVDHAIRELLADDAATKTRQRDIRADARAMRKLWKEAQRVKHILSANQEAAVRVESLIGDVDYRSSISRAQLEDRCAAFAGKFTEPLDEAIRLAGLSKEQLTSVILFGGNTRVPMVQSAIKQSVPEEMIAQNVNTDEAAVLGAAFFGASTGRQVQTRVKMNVTEIATYEISAAVDGGGTNEVVFPVGAALGSRHTMTLPAKRGSSQQVAFAYSGRDAPRPIELSSVKLDVDQALRNLSDAEIAAAEVKITVRIDNRGIFSAANAVVSTTTKPESVAGKLMGLFGSKNKEDNADAGAEKEDGDDDDQTEQDAAPREKRVPIKFVESQAYRSIATETKKSARQRLSKIEAVERSVVARAEARNLLEGYLYRISELLSPEANTRAIHDFATAEEKQKMQEVVHDAFEWMAEHGDTADEGELKQKRSDVESLEAPVIRRYTEFTGRPKALEDFQKAMFAGRLFFVEAKKNLSEALAADLPSKYTDEELDPIGHMLKEYEEWLTPLVDKQTKANEIYSSEPVILISDLETRGRALQAAVKRIERKPEPKPRKSATTSSSSSTASAFSATESTTSSSSESTSAKSEAPSATTTTSIPAHEEL